MNIFSNLNNNGLISEENNRRVEIKKDDFTKLTHSNLIFDTRDKIWYKSFNRYGWINLLDTDTVAREYLFFTKPDLYIYDGNTFNNATLNSTFRSNGFFIDVDQRNKDALTSLQYSIKDRNGNKDPFIRILSNMVISKLDMPRISSETQQSTANVYGSIISYRSHSFKSDYGYDFSLTFRDSRYLDIYNMVKAYDEFMRHSKMGEIDYGFDYNSKGSGDTHNTAEIYKSYIKAHIIPEQFSIYKFIVGSDGETIIFFAKYTGVYFVDVPRDEFSEPDTSNGFKYSVSFHANFVRDMDPLIITEFNKLSLGSDLDSDYLPVYNKDSGNINNEPALYPRVVVVKNDKRTMRRNTSFDYRLKWTNLKKGEKAVPEHDYTKSLHVVQ